MDSPAVQVIQHDWSQTVYPILQDACFDCHTCEDADGSLDLSQFQTVEQVVAERRLWRKIATRIADHQMPPPDSTELSDDDRRRLLGWIDDSLHSVPCSHPHHAGSVTIRRLTRYEYANTSRDLFHVDFPDSDQFPADGVGYGFDNIGDVLSVSPLLLEKYLTAADTISESVIVDPKKFHLSKTLDPG